MGGRILVIDDEPCIRQVLEIHLGSAGHAVFSAETAAEGLRLVSSEDISMVICDFSLPDMNGDELVIAIKKARAGVPVLVISGFIDEEYARTVKGHGALEYLAKPFSKEALLSAVNSALSA